MEANDALALTGFNEGFLQVVIGLPRQSGCALAEQRAALPENRRGLYTQSAIGSFVDSISTVIRYTLPPDHPLR